jgi:hypothetical protein
MPFIGAINQGLRSILAEMAPRWRDRPVYVACSGNFTVERTLAASGFKLHSNDVSLYSCALGQWLAGQEVTFRVREEFEDELGWFAEKLDGGSGSVAALMLATRFFDVLERPGLFYERQAAAHRKQFPTMWEQTKAKLDKVTMRLAGFDAEDGMTWLDRVPEEGIVVSFPPTFAGGYEKMWAALDKHLTWDPPGYEVMDGDGARVLIDKIMARPTWVCAHDVRYDDLEPWLRGIVQPTNRSKPHHVWAATNGSRIALPRQNIELVRHPRLGLGDELVGPLRFHPLKEPQFNALRSQYLNENIVPAAGVWAYAISAGGRLIGAVGFAQPKWDPYSLYLLSDFAVAPSDYPRLSKLVVMALTSREFQLIAQRSLGRRLTGVSTTAFTNNPVSMKYRGILNLHSRKEMPAGEHFKFALTYSGPIGQRSLDEVLTVWQEKWGQRR